MELAGQDGSEGVEAWQPLIHWLIGELVSEQDMWNTWAQLLASRKWPSIAASVLEKASGFLDRYVEEENKWGWFGLHLVSCGVLQTIVAPLLRCPGFLESLCKFVLAFGDSENDEICEISDDLFSNEVFSNEGIMWGLYDIMWSNEFDSCHVAIAEAFSDNKEVTEMIKCGALCFAAVKVLRLLPACRGAGDAGGRVWRKLKVLIKYPAEKKLSEEENKEIWDLLADLLESDDLISDLLGVVDSPEVDSLFDAIVAWHDSAELANNGEAAVVKNEEEEEEEEEEEDLRPFCNLAKGPLKSLFVEVLNVKDLRTAISGGLRLPLDQFKASTILVVIQGKLDVINLLLQNRGSLLRSLLFYGMNPAAVYLLSCWPIWGLMRSKVLAQLRSAQCFLHQGLS